MSIDSQANEYDHKLHEMSWKWLFVLKSVEVVNYQGIKEDEEKLAVEHQLKR